MFLFDFVCCDGGHGTRYFSLLEIIMLIPELIFISPLDYSTTPKCQNCMAFSSNLTEKRNIWSNILAKVQHLNQIINDILPPLS